MLLLIGLRLPNDVEVYRYKLQLRFQLLIDRMRIIGQLVLILKRFGQIFSKSKLVDRLFSYDQSVTENAIEVYIGRLRRHLVDADLSITTIRGLGYKLEKSELL